jgi:predicted nucleic acid-binding protein
MVDSNVIIDVASGDPKWRGWSWDASRIAADRNEIAINPISPD